MDKMKRISLIILFLGFIVNNSLISQSFYFGPKAGIGLNTQQWNNFDRDPLFSFFGDVFIESYDEGSPSSLYAQLGYHTRGSSLRLATFNSGFFSNAFKFNNLVFAAAAKRVLSSSKNTKPYYLLGIRGEYTLSTNLNDFTEYQSIFYPIEFYVNKFNYGFIVGGGFDFKMSDLYGAFVEFVISPDISLQYQQPAIPNVINPYNGRSTTIGERRIRNLSLEITFGMRFLRKVEYY